MKKADNLYDIFELCKDETIQICNILEELDKQIKNLNEIIMLAYEKYKNDENKLLYAFIMIGFKAGYMNINEILAQEIQEIKNIFSEIEFSRNNEIH